MIVSIIKKEIVSIGKLLYERKLIAGTDGNISARVRDIIITTPSGICKGFMKTKDLISVDLLGNKIKGRGKPSSELKMHLEVYRSREDVRAVVHAHPMMCLALNLGANGLDECIIPELVVSLGAIPNIPYKTPSTDYLAQSISHVITKTDALMLDKHGSLTVGSTLKEAYFKLEQMEHGASIMLYAKMLGKVDVLSKEDLDSLMKLRQSTYSMSNPIIPFV